VIAIFKLFNFFTLADDLARLNPFTFS